MRIRGVEQGSPHHATKKPRRQKEPTTASTVTERSPDIIFRFARAGNGLILQLLQQESRQSCAQQQQSEAAADECIQRVQQTQSCSLCKDALRSCDTQVSE